MNLIIDFDAINDVGKKDWLLRNLKIMGIDFYTSEEPQTLDEYNNELEEGSAEIEKGKLCNKRTIEERCYVMVTVWTPKASAELRKAFDYISQNSPQNAKKVIDEIIALADKLPQYPEIYSLDKYKRNNDGSCAPLKNFITESLTTLPKKKSK